MVTIDQPGETHFHVEAVLGGQGDPEYRLGFVNGDMANTAYTALDNQLRAMGYLEDRDDPDRHNSTLYVTQPRLLASWRIRIEEVVGDGADCPRCSAA